MMLSDVELEASRNTAHRSCDACVILFGGRTCTPIIPWNRFTFVKNQCPFIALTMFPHFAWAPANLRPKSPGFVDMKKPTELLVCIHM